MDVATAASLFEALGSSARLRVLIELRQAGDTGLSVGTLQERLGIEAKSTLSNHLRQLVHAGLITQERRSTVLLCRAPADPLAELLDFLAQVTLSQRASSSP